MENLFTGVALGAVAALIAMVIFRLGRRTAPRSAPVHVHASVDSIRAVGELVVLKVFTQQIVTKTNHLMGDWGEKWMGWFLSPKKTAMIFDFMVDFRYDLRSPKFEPRVLGERSLELVMPPCFYEIQLKDIRIYDERGSALVPLLLPEWIGQVFGGKFSEKEKNDLIALARVQAEGMARQLAQRVMGEVRQSAETTLRQIARTMEFDAVAFRFSDASPMLGSVDLSNIEQAAQDAVTMDEPGNRA